jgi:outer membrane immunogenic protein
MTRTFLGVVGISTLLVAMPLSAASAAGKAPPPPPQSPVDGWTGFYAGMEVGGVFGASNQIDNGPFGFGPTTPGYKVTGALAGGTVGYNWQTGNWVWGLEGDMSWTNVSGGAHEMAPFATSTFVDTKENWLATGRGRLGWSTANNILFYATGGIAAASVKADIVQNAGALTLTEAQTRWGGAIGGGVEIKLTSSRSLKKSFCKGPAV